MDCIISSIAQKWFHPFGSRCNSSSALIYTFAAKQEPSFHQPLHGPGNSSSLALLPRVNAHAHVFAHVTLQLPRSQTSIESVTSRLPSGQLPFAQHEVESPVTGVCVPSWGLLPRYITSPWPCLFALSELALQRAGMSADAGKKRGRGPVHAPAPGDRKPKKKPKRKESYSVYIYKVLKQVSKYFSSARHWFVCRVTFAHCILTL